VTDPGGRTSLAGGIGLVVGVTLGILVTLRVIDRQRSSPPPSPAGVRSAPAGSAEAEPSPSFLGVTVAPESLTINSETDGRIVELAVDVGDHVQAGDTLVVIDSRTLRRELSAAQAALEVALAEEQGVSKQLHQMQETRARVDGLGTMTSQEERSNARYAEEFKDADNRRAHGIVRRQTAEIERIRTLLDHCRVRAPFNGVIAERLLVRGAAVRPGTPILVVNATRQSSIRFAVPPDVATRLSKGATVQAQLETAPGHTPAVIERIAPEVDAAARLVFVEAALSVDPRQQPLPTGLLARVRLDGSPPR
jgi:RND family efflux transporter MFP subunit